MSNTPYVKAVMAQAALERLPPVIRNTLLAEQKFRKNYELKTDAFLALGDSDVSIQRSALFNAIHEILSGVTEQCITDTNDREWIVKNEAENGNAPKLVISADERRFTLPDFTVLCPDSAMRLRSLDECASDVNLPANARNAWRQVLSERALENEEVDQFNSEFRDTPVHVARSIRSDIETGQSTMTAPVPTSRRYFERLVGGYDGSKSIRDYAAGTGRQFIEQLFEWRTYDGFLLSLLLSSHSAMTAEISVDNLGNEDLMRAFDFLEKQGDVLSQLGAIEVGLRILPERPAIEPHVIRLVEKIRDDNVEDSSGGFKVFSALFILVDGELSRTRLMSEEPPFYRRLASLSQAALIHRQIAIFGADDTFFEWAYSNRLRQYYQTFTDMRLEPGWHPEFSEASQMKADFFGRIRLAAMNYEENIKNSVLHDLILGADLHSLNSLCEFLYPYPFYPGPLEGAEDSPNALPADLSDTIEAQLTEEEVGPSSFIALVNSVMIFRVDSGQVELAAKALKLTNHRLKNVENKSQLFDILNGLATVAAIARSSSLADELRILIHRYRHDAQYGLSIKEAMRICLVASASRKDLIHWREFVGDWLTELAFGELKSDEGNIFHSHLRCLCHAVPELWVSCARADAALMAFNDR